MKQIENFTYTIEVREREVIELARDRAAALAQNESLSEELVRLATERDQ